MKINKKLIISLVCIIVSLCFSGGACIQFVGMTKSKLSSGLKAVSSAGDIDDIAEKFGVEDTEGIKSVVNSIKDYKLSYKELNQDIKVIMDNEESIMQLAEYGSLISAAFSDDSEETDIEGKVGKLFTLLKFERLVAFLLIVTAIAAIAACIVWNRKVFVLPYMVMQILVAAGLIILTIVLNRNNIEVRITLFTWLLPLLAVSAFVFMPSGNLLEMFGSINIGGFKGNLGSIKETVQSTVEKAEKMGASAASGIHTIAKKKEEFTWGCPECGYRNPDENNYCGKCGTKRPELSDDAKRIIAELELQISSLKDENEQLKKGNEEEIKKAVNALEEENKSLNIKKDAVLFEAGKLKEELAKAEEEAAELKAEIVKLNSNDTEKVNKAVAEKEEELRKLTEEKDLLEENIRKLSSEKDIAEKECTDLKNDNEKLSTEIAGLKGDAKKKGISERKIAGYTEEIKDLQQQNLELTGRIKEYDDSNAKLTENLNLATGEIDKLTDSNAALAKELEETKVMLETAKNNQRSFCRYCGHTLD